MVYNELAAYSALSYYSLCHLKVVYSPLHTDGIGLSDGEVMERMWSFLRGFNKMTKEMRPSHRIDVLTHALWYYGFLTKNKLRKFLALIYCMLVKLFLFCFSNIAQ